MRINKLNNSKLSFLTILTLLFSTMFLTSPASADLRVCNKTANQINIALGYRAERGWQSEGWWLAASNDCITVFQGDLNSRFYYLFAVDDIGGGAWDGPVYLCTRDETFTIFSVDDCLARGYERTGFFEIDTRNEANWTLELREEQISNTSEVEPDTMSPETDKEQM